MRIIAGDWRGRKLAEPKGRETTRPTTDRVREACASMIDAALDDGIEGSRVLDAFAGSGAMGIEMLSRGAAHATFFDLDRTAASLVKSNLQALSCPAARASVTTGDVLLAAQRGRMAGAPFDVVILDPPYAFPAQTVASLLENLAAHGMLRDGALALYEHARASAGVEAAGFIELRDKRYGSTSVQLLRLRPEASEGDGGPSGDLADSGDARE